MLDAHPGRGPTLDKAEAITVLREINTVCPEFGYSANFVSIDPDEGKISKDSNGFYKLRIKCDIDVSSKNAIKLILDSHKLEMTETNGLITIYRRHN